MSSSSRRVLVGALALGFLLMAVPGLASAANNGTLTLEWDANVTDPDLSGYRAYLSSDPALFSLTPAQAAVVAVTRLVDRSTLTVTFTSLDTTKTYYGAVTALDTSANESVFSQVVSAQPFAAPTLSSVSPASAEQGATALNVTLTGTDFQTTTVVSFGPGVAVSALNTSGIPTRLVATIDVDPLAQVDLRDVTATNPGNAIATRPSAFEVLLDMARVDINTSSRVDGGDMVLVAAGFATHSSDPGYSTSIDLNVDGVVDGTDVALLVTYFGFIGPF